ncbi:MAG: metallophosphoesterase, partial [Promethearchaeota archaeon]
MAKIFAISDLHLPIHIQIKKFKYPLDYYNRIIEHLEKFKPDLLIIVGDFSY